jgi:hypothetical protein
MTTIIGDAFLGKTFLALEVIRSVTTLEPLFGREVFGKPRTVMYLTTDPRGERTLARRARDHGIDMDKVYGQSFYTPDDKREWENIVRDLREFDIGMVVVDNTSDLSVDANAPREVKQITDGLRRIVDSGIALLTIHHRNVAHSDFGSILWTKSTRAKLELQGNPRRAKRTLKGVFNDQGAHEWELWFDPRRERSFELLGEKDSDAVREQADERAEAQQQKRKQSSREKNDEIRQWIVDNCQGQTLRGAAQMVADQFGGSMSAAKNILSDRRAYGEGLVRHGQAWTTDVPSANGKGKTVRAGRELTLV